MPMFPAVVDLATLDGTQGFRIDGIDPDDNSGWSVASAGDVNGDGFADLVVGAPYAANRRGEAYVVFGHAGGFAPSLDLSTLDGSNGFVVVGGGALGWSVASAGDVNGDGLDDLILGARSANVGNNPAGQSYVVFGRSDGFAARINFAALNGSNGFRINGIDAADNVGWSVASAGDVNNDGYDDVIIGSPHADRGTFNPELSVGAAYVVFGHGGSFSADFALSSLNGFNGFGFEGMAAGDRLGFSVDAAGDVDGDGYDDLIIGVPDRNNISAGNDNEGEAYVILSGNVNRAGGGTLGWNLNGTEGFRILGDGIEDHAGRSVAGAGDINGDGFADLIVGAPDADSDGGNSGESYVVFGHAGQFPRRFASAGLDGTNGFRIQGAHLRENSGYSVASAGDFNGDGFDDLVIGAPGVSAGSNNSDGAVYVVFGHAGGFASTLDLATLNGINGFRLIGIDLEDYSGRSVASAGDVNGDGFDDLIIGAWGADPGGDGDAGESYVIFGGPGVTPVTIHGDSGINRLAGTGGADILEGRGGNDVLNGLGAGDLMRGGGGRDRYYVDDIADVIEELAGASGGEDLVRARIDYTLGANLENLVIGGAARTGIGNALHNEITGADSSNLLSGLAGNDVLDGGAGRDTLLGGDGSDRLIGGVGMDILTGGSGADTFVFGDGDMGRTAKLADVITDFNQKGDTIDLAGIDADAVATGDQAFAFIGDAAFAGLAGQLHYLHQDGMTYLEGDTDGDGTADFVIALTGTLGLTASDFVL